MTRTRLIALILTLFLVSNSVYAQSKKTRSTKKTAKTVVVETPVEPEIPVLPVDTAVVDSVQADTVVIEVPKDRTDTIYYDKTWRVISNKTFATYYRYALYPADSLAPKYFKTFYLNGELQGEGNFIELGDRNDANSIFDGEIDYYYPGGALKRRMFYSNGKSNGECTDYYENGNIKEHISIIDGKKHGINSSFTEDGIVCIGMAQDKFMRICYIGCHQHFFYRGIWLGICYIIENSIGKHHGCLLNIAYLCSEIAHINCFDVLAVEKNLTVIVVIEAHEKIYQRCFAGACRSYYADGFAGLYSEIYIGENIFCLIEREAYMAEFHLAAYMVGYIAFSVIMLRLGIKNVHYALCRGKSALIRVVQSRKKVYGSVEHRSI